jgi:hypothetical protein
MIAPWLLCALCLLTQAAYSQSPERGEPPRGRELELPDVLLFGRDTVYLSVPLPCSIIDLPQLSFPPAGGEGRLQLPDRLTPEAVPAPPSAVPVGASLRPGPSLAQGRRAAVEAPQPGTPGEPAASLPAGTADRAWDASVEYLPTIDLNGRFAAQSVRGRWSGSSLLSVVLPDGWSALQPAFAGHVLFAGREAWDGASMRFAATASGGVLDPPANPRTYTLEASQQLAATGRFAQLSEDSMLQLQSREDPAVVRVAAAQQGLSIVVGGRTLGLSLEAVAAARLESGSDLPEVNAALNALVSYRSRKGGLQIATGASGLYYAERLSLYPAAVVELHPLIWLSIRGRAAAFLQLVPEPELYAMYTPAAVALLQPEGGYRVESSLGVDLTPAFEASGSAWYAAGRMHELAGDELLFERTRQAGGALELAWRSRSWASLHAQGSAAWDLSEAVSPVRWSAAAWLQGDFSKVPATLIMLLFWGDLFGRGAEPALFSEWEVFDGFAAAMRGRLWFRPDQGLEAGVQLLVPEGSSAVQTRVLVGYNARLRASVTNSRRR